MKNNISLNDKLIKDTFTTITDKILILSEEEVDQIFNNINQSIDSLDKCDELYVLEELRNKFEDKIVYHRTRLRLYRKYDWNFFNIDTVVLIIAIVWVYLSYIAIFHYNFLGKTIAFFKISKDYDGVLGFVFMVIVGCICKLLVKCIFFILLVVPIIVIIAMLILIGQWIWPKDKERYEKWSVMKARIEKRISLLKQ
jgi:hypothetical protein